jgi:hypothetical protein
MSEHSDYLEEIGVTMSPMKERAGLVLYQPDQIQCTFRDIESATLRAHVNNAMSVVVAHFSVRAERAGIKLSRRQLLELSMRLVLRTLSGRYAETKQLDELAIRDSDLRTELALLDCWAYCEPIWLADYATIVAALMGMSLHQLRRYQADNRDRLESQGFFSNRFPNNPAPSPG